MDTRTTDLVAVLADASPNTVRRYVRGLPIRPSSRRRITAAMMELGIEPSAYPPPRDATTPR